jgi:hypothetical protein
MAAEVIGAIGLAIMPAIAWIVAQATPESMPVWSSLGANVVLSGLCVFLITKGVPAERDANRQDIKAARDDFAKMLGDVSTKHSDEISQILSELKQSREQFFNEVGIQQKFFTDTVHELRGKFQVLVAPNQMDQLKSGHVVELGEVSKALKQDRDK